MLYIEENSSYLTVEGKHANITIYTLLYIMSAKR